MGRYVDPFNGRFISEDGLGFDAGDSNLYRYVFNSPTNYTDPDGNIPAVLIPLGIGAAEAIGIGLTGLGAAGLLWQFKPNPESEQKNQENNSGSKAELNDRPQRPTPTPTPEPKKNIPLNPNNECDKDKKTCETEYPEYSLLPQGLKFRAFEDTDLFATIRLMKVYRGREFNNYEDLKQGKTEPMTKKRYKDPNYIATHYNIDIVNGHGALGGSIGKYEFCIENENSPYIQKRYGILNIKSTPDRKNRQRFIGSDP